MPVKAPYEEDQGQSTTGALGLLGIIGQSHTLAKGWSLFSLKTLLVCNAAATVFGLAGMMLTHPYIGHVMGFLAGAGFGFVGGLRHRWYTDTREALRTLERFPDIMRHHLLLVEPSLFDRVPFERWRGTLHCNPMKMGFAVAALYSAADALDRLRNEEEELLIAQAVQKLQERMAQYEQERAAEKTE